MVVDPVCGMEIEEQMAAATRTVDGTTYYFCSDRCAGQFDASPAEFIPSTGSGHRAEALPATVTDPVCGMTIDPAGAVATRDVAGQTYYFCSDSCVDKFDATPKAYTKAPAGDGHGTTKRAIPSITTGVPDKVEGPVRAEMTSLAQLRAAVESTGYKTRPAAGEEEPIDKEAEEQEREYRTLLRKFWVAAIISLPVLLTAYPQFVPVIRDLPASKTFRDAGLLSSASKSVKRSGCALKRCRKN